MSELKVGARAPAFTLSDQQGRKVKLTDFKGKRLVVYFYPKADTPGCTTQSCSVRDALPGSQEAEERRRRHQPRPAGEAGEVRHEVRPRLPLARRQEHQVAEKWGVWGEKSMYGKKYMGIVRSAFVVDEQGKIAAAFYKVSPKDTVPKVTDALKG